MAIRKSHAFIFTMLLVQSVLLVGGAFAQIAENFDGIATPNLPGGGWTSAKTGLGSGWKTVITNAKSTPNSVFADDVSTPAISTLTTPAFIFDGNHIFSFQHLYDLEAPGSPSLNAFDGGVLEVSVAGGAFVDIFAAPGFYSSCPYDRTVIGVSNPLIGRKAWSGSNGSFKSCIVFIPPSAAGQLVKFRWILGSDTSVSKPGWWIDDVVLQPFPNISISEVESPSPAVAGQNVTYVTKATNTSSMNATIQFAKVFPRSSSLVSVVPSDSAATLNPSAPTASDPQVTVEFLNVSAGQSVTLTTVVKLNNPVGGDALLTVNSPGLVAGDIVGRPALFGPALSPSGVTGDLIFPKDSASPEQDGCDVLLNGPALNGKIAVLFLAGKCSPQVAALNVQNAGAIGAVFLNTIGSSLADIPSSLPTPVSIPSIGISAGAGIGLFYSMILFNTTPNATLSSPSGVIASSASLASVSDSDWSNDRAASITPVVPDSDGDGVADGSDQCPVDPSKSAPGVCGCGVLDSDSNSNNVADCLFTKDLKVQVGKAISSLKKLISSPTNKKAKAKNTQLKSNLQTLLSQINSISQAGAASIQLKSNKVPLAKLSGSAASKLSKALKLKRASFGADKKNALDALTKLSKALNA